MAKGNGLFGNWTGTIGNVVGFITRSATGETGQGIRSKASTTTNVKSFAQASVRMRMQPIQNCYRALKDVIDRGFEGVKYGPNSYQHFLKLSQDNFGGPYIVKGDKRLIPGPFPISRGTLLPVTVNGYHKGSNTQGDYSGFETDLFVPRSIDFSGRNWGSFWQDVMMMNTDIKEGDQFTFVQCNQYGNNFAWNIASIVVDVTDTRHFGDESPVLEVNKVSDGTNGRFVVQIAHNSDETPVAFGVIQARNGQNVRMVGDLEIAIKTGNTKNFNLRSNCNIYVRTELQYEFMSSVAYQRAVATYMGASISEMDWPTIQIASQMYKATVLVPAPSGFVVPSSFAGNDVLGFITPTGSFGYFYKKKIDDDSLYLLDSEGNILHASDGTGLVDVTISPNVQAPLLQWVYGLYQTL